ALTQFRASPQPGTYSDDHRIRRPASRLPPRLRQNRAGETHGPEESLRDINRQCERTHKPGYSVLAQAASRPGTPQGWPGGRPPGPPAGGWGERPGPPGSLAAAATLPVPVAVLAPVPVR